jgi:hypothetical protein
MTDHLWLRQRRFGKFIELPFFSSEIYIIFMSKHLVFTKQISYYQCVKKISWISN